MDCKLKILSVIVFLLSLFSCNFDKKEETTAETTPKIAGILPQESEFYILVNPDEIPIDKEHLFLDFDGSPCLLIDSLIFPLLSNKNGGPSVFPNSIISNQISCFYDGSMIFLKDSLLKKIHNNEIIFTIPFPHKNMYIEKAGENGVYLHGFNPINEKYELFFIDNREHLFSKVLSDTISINAVVGTGDISMVAMDSIIYILAEGEMQAVFNAKKIITSLADSETGIFFATSDNVGYFDNQYNSIIFHNTGAAKLLTQKDTLYMLETNGRFSFITQIDNFKNLTDSITQK